MGCYRIAAYITAYEDVQALNTCLGALQAQTYPIAQVLVVDNSRQPLALNSAITSQLKLQVWHHPENIGIAAGINQAIVWAQTHGYDFLWTFDQDSVPQSDCLQQLINTYDETATVAYPIGILGPRAIDLRNDTVITPAVFRQDYFHGYEPPPGTTKPFECDAPITSGSLLWLPASRKVELLDARLFIDGIDLDYGLRLLQAGFHNLIVPAAVMHHCFGNPIILEMLGRKRAVPLYSALRHYYIARNHTYLVLHHYTEGLARLTGLLKRFDYAITTILSILLFDPRHKFEKLWACAIGTFHGLLGHLDWSWAAAKSSPQSDPSDPINQDNRRYPRHN
jgi:rhamnosyltransferase